MTRKTTNLNKKSYKNPEKSTSASKRNNAKHDKIKPDFRKLASEYFSKTKKDRGIMLKNLASVYHRSTNSLSHSLNNAYKTRKRPFGRQKRGRPKKYYGEVLEALEFIWESYDYPAADRIYYDIPDIINIFKEQNDWTFSDDATKLLTKMSLGSMKQYGAKISRDKGSMRGISTTRSNNTLFKEIPTSYGDWQNKPLGYGQIDTVVHSGERLEGDSMLYSLNYVEVNTFWRVQVSQPNKGEQATLKSLQYIAKRIPFKITGLHPDSGSEFINYTLLRWTRANGIEYTRSRPSKKNDNCYVEQRNNSTIRKYIGYARYDCKEAMDVMNELYEVIYCYENFFQPTKRLIDKKRDDKTGKYKKVYDKPRTPYARVLERDDVSEANKEKLKKLRKTLNPRLLRDKIKALTRKLQQVQQEQGYHF